MFPKTRITIPSPLVTEGTKRTVSVHWKKLMLSEWEHSRGFV